MPAHPRLPVRARSITPATQWPWGVFAALAIAFASGCGGTPTCHDCGEGGAGGSGGSSGAGECTSTLGHLTGTVYRWSAPGNPDSELAPNSSVLLYSSPSATPIYGQVDGEGHFDIEIEAGPWIVRAEDTGGCQTGDATSVTLDPCETEELILVMNECVDG